MVSVPMFVSGPGLLALSFGMVNVPLMVTVVPVNLYSLGPVLVALA